MLDMLRKLDEAEDSIGEKIAENIALVEYYYGVQIDEHYLLMKRLNQQEHLKEFIKVDYENMYAAVGNAIAKSFK